MTPAIFMFLLSFFTTFRAFNPELKWTVKYAIFKFFNDLIADLTVFGISLSFKSRKII